MSHVHASSTVLSVRYRTPGTGWSRKTLQGPRNRLHWSSSTAPRQVAGPAGPLHSSRRSSRRYFQPWFKSRRLSRGQISVVEARGDAGPVMEDRSARCRRTRKQSARGGRRKPGRFRGGVVVVYKRARRVRDESVRQDYIQRRRRRVRIGDRAGVVDSGRVRDVGPRWARRLSDGLSLSVCGYAISSKGREMRAGCRRTEGRPLAVSNPSSRE